MRGKLHIVEASQQLSMELSGSSPCGQVGADICSKTVYTSHQPIGSNHVTQTTQSALASAIEDPAWMNGRH